MKPNECERCGLAESRLHTSKNLGRAKAEVLVIFGKEPYTRANVTNMRLFLQSLNPVLEGDWSATFAIRCSGNTPVAPEHIKACRFWLSNTISRVDPYLIILVGDLSVKAVLGAKYKGLPLNTFYNKKRKGKSRKYYLAPNLGVSNSEMEFTVDKLLSYIRSAYG